MSSNEQLQNALTLIANADNLVTLSDDNQWSFTPAVEQAEALVPGAGGAGVAAPALSAAAQATVNAAVARSNAAAAITPQAVVSSDADPAVTSTVTQNADGAAAVKTTVQNTATGILDDLNVIGKIGDDIVALEQGGSCKLHWWGWEANLNEAATLALEDLLAVETAKLAVILAAFAGTIPVVAAVAGIVSVVAATLAADVKTGDSNQNGVNMKGYLWVGLSVHAN